MLTREQINILATDEMRGEVAANIGRDPLKVALDKRLPHAQLVATQVKYLQRARTKLPSYYDAQCIIPPLAFEQSSGEKAAAQRRFSGAHAIDLTCGLGVDAFYLSKHFDKVTTVEADPILAEVARINFGLLGAANITVVNSTAEEFLAANPLKYRRRRLSRFWKN